MTNKPRYRYDWKGSRWFKRVDTGFFVLMVPILTNKEYGRFSSALKASCVTITPNRESEPKPEI